MKQGGSRDFLLRAGRDRLATSDGTRRNSGTATAHSAAARSGFTCMCIRQVGPLGGRTIVRAEGHRPRIEPCSSRSTNRDLPTRVEATMPKGSRSRPTRSEGPRFVHKARLLGVVRAKLGKIAGPRSQVIASDRVHTKGKRPWPVASPQPRWPCGNSRRIMPDGYFTHPPVTQRAGSHGAARRATGTASMRPRLARGRKAAISAPSRAETGASTPGNGDANRVARHERIAAADRVESAAPRWFSSHYSLSVFPRRSAIPREGFGGSKPLAPTTNSSTWSVESFGREAIDGGHRPAPWSAPAASSRPPGSGRCVRAGRSSAPAARRGCRPPAQ
jgi:hypothetical protein